MYESVRDYLYLFRDTLRKDTFKLRKEKKIRSNGYDCCKQGRLLVPWAGGKASFQGTSMSYTLTPQIWGPNKGVGKFLKLN